ncbi:uncharacterized protein PgNI_03725 [Pyricularia grisea]|uniref:Uncharacterized protein n=1 Tax=Pyricularia grisea TaxID=148305 RepID=A0A6P8BBC9_PYRGI|nr:uncharacterized protein PgNI_03725 [Pyricularia grisea]TLD13002.1 hypothetical protein PgNI_03725 [Pyricularia grisea]
MCQYRIVGRNATMSYQLRSIYVGGEQAGNPSNTSRQNISVCCTYLRSSKIKSWVSC